MFSKGDVLNNTYQIVDEIGAGGTGVIYLVYHLRLQKYVVIKRIKDNYIGKINARVEVDMLKQLHHKGLPQVYDFIETANGTIYTVIDYIDGMDLEHYLKLGYYFTEEQLTYYLIQLLDVLIYLHGQNPPIIHSDIKPANIMLDKQGNAYLIDFNISFDGEQRKVAGISQAYGSYEQLEMARRIMNHLDTSDIFVDERTDIYSLGATFYELMTGVTPYVGIEEEYSICNYDLPYSDAFVAIIHNAMCWNMQERYQTAEEMKKAVTNIYKNSWKYKAKRVGITVGIIAGTVLISGISIGLVNFEKRKKEQLFNSEYQAIVQEANDGYAVGRTARELLNKEEYINLLDKEADKKAELLFICAREYIEQKQYNDAEPYLQEAIQLSGKAKYYRDYAIVLIQLEQKAEATEILNQAEQNGLTSYDMDLIRAELKFQAGECNEATQLLEGILINCEDDELRYQAMVMMVKDADYTGEYSQLIIALENTTFQYEYQDQYYRYLIYAYVKQATNTDGEDRVQNYRSAVTYYERIKNPQILSERDRISIAFAYNYANQPGKGQDILNQLEKEYGDDYVIYVEIALYCYDVESRRSPQTRDYSMMIEYYEKAKELSTQLGNTNSDMQQLETIMNELEEKGWINEGRKDYAVLQLWSRK